MDKRKLALLTIWKNANHGTALQAYALHKYINTLGLNAEYMLYDSRAKKHIVHYIIECFNNLILSFSKKKISEDIEQYHNNCRPIMQFWDDIPHSKIIYNRKTCMKSLEEYYLYIVGSDQVWNPYITYDKTFFFLRFVKNADLKNSYSPSFGIAKLPILYKFFLKKNLLTFNNVGCRDNKPSNILTGYIKKEITRTVDPVFLLSKREWKACEEKISLPSNFLLCYQLGDSTDLLSYANTLAKKLRLAILLLTYNSEPYSIANISPKNFIHIISNAQYVVTDSYHGIAFSIIFGKRFTPFYKRPGNMYTMDNWRLYELCQMIGSEVGKECLFEDSYCDILKNEIIKSKNYLNKILL